MSFSILTLSGRASIAVTMAVLLVMPVNVVSAAPAVNGRMDYDIPVSELNKVKKKTPSKHVKKESRRKKTSDAKPQKSPLESTVPVEPAGHGQTITPPAEMNKAVRSEPVHQRPPSAAESLPDQESIRILHSPYSFVVAGKRTVIQAVIDSKTDIKEVSCRLRATGDNVPTPVKMARVNGTQFTYTAALPGLSPESPSLGYTIYAVDTLGRVTRSREFVTPVKPSSFVPGWQIEGVDEKIPIEQKKSTE